jgi:hypothetical protein
MERSESDGGSTVGRRDPRRTRRAFVAALGATATAALAGCGAPSGKSHPSIDEATLETLLGTVTMYKAPGCACCEEYATYLASVEDVGVSTSETEDLPGVKSRFGVPDDLGSCHTIDTGEYAIEGHVPLEAVEKLATERPDVKGIALPGMPAGSPGMGGSKSGKFTVYAFYEDREPTEFVSV